MIRVAKVVESWQSHGLRSLSRSGWRHDGPSGWTVLEAAAVAEHGNQRIEALYLNHAAAPAAQLGLWGGEQ